MYHIVGAVSDSAISLFINGQVVISQSLPNDASITDSTAHVYIGGKGGDLRKAYTDVVNELKKFDADQNYKNEYADMLRFKDYLKKTCKQ